MATYAGMKGRARRNEPEAPARQPLPPLPAWKQEQVAANKALIEEHMPEMLPEIKALYEAGLIEGWRSVVKVELLEGADDGHS